MADMDDQEVAENSNGFDEDQASPPQETPAPIAAGAASPEEAPEEEEEEEEEPAEEQEAPGQPAASSEADDEPEDEATPEAPAPVNNPVAGQKPSQVISAITNPTAQDMDQEHIKLAQDLAVGAIHPESLQSLFAQKSTLGKIGTIFGLLVSGAGSGLSHQKNAALEAMNQQIQNDLQAQIERKHGANTLLSTMYNHELQQAQTKLAAAETTGVPIRNLLNQATVSNLKEDTKLKTVNNTKAGMIVTMLQGLSSSVGKQPPASRGVSQQVLDNDVIPYFKNQIQQGNAQTAAKLQTVNSMRSTNEAPIQGAPQASAANDKGVDLNALNQMKLDSQLGQENGIPTSLPAGQMGAIDKEAAQVMQNRVIHKNWLDSFNKLAASPIADKQYPAIRDAYVNTLATQLSSQAGGKSYEEERKLVDAMFPQFGDRLQPGAINAKRQKAEEHFQSMESDTPLLDSLNLKTPFPKSTSSGRSFIPDGKGGWKSTSPNIAAPKASVQDSASTGQATIPNGYGGWNTVPPEKMVQR